MSTASGTNDFHGSAYVHRGTNWINAAPFFFKQDRSSRTTRRVPQLHRYIAGGTFGGPIIKDKLFGFSPTSTSTCRIRRSATRFLDVPVGLQTTNRIAAGAWRHVLIEFRQ